jgi:hypothetical protein
MTLNVFQKTETVFCLNLGGSTAYLVLQNKFNP